MKEVKCEVCDGDGFIVSEDYEPDCCGCFSDQGECCGSPQPMPVQVQHQCPMCFGDGFTLTD